MGSRAGCHHVGGGGPVRRSPLGGRSGYGGQGDPVRDLVQRARSRPAPPATSTGAVNASHDSMTADRWRGGAGQHAARGGVARRGRLRPVRDLDAAIVAVFVAGLMVGRTPELLGKKIGAQRDDAGGRLRAGLTRAVLVGPGLAMALASTPGRHGQLRWSRVLRGASTPTPRPPTTTAAPSPADGHLRLLPAHAGGGHAARPVRPMVLVLALAGRLARRRRCPPPPAPCPPTPLFVALLVGVIVLVSGLTFFPALRWARSRRRCREYSRPARPGRSHLAGASELTSRRGRTAAPAVAAPCREALRKLDPRHAVAEPGDVRGLDRLGGHDDRRGRADRACS